MGGGGIFLESGVGNINLDCMGRLSTLFIKIKLKKINKSLRALSWDFFSKSVIKLKKKYYRKLDHKNEINFSKILLMLTEDVMGKNAGMWFVIISLL